MTDVILVLNIGSSSIKFAVHEADSESSEPFCRGVIEQIGTAPRLIADGVPSQAFGALSPDDERDTLVGRLAAWLVEALPGHRLVAAGHRVVHGGPDFATAVLIDDDVLARLERLAPLAPTHQLGTLAGVTALAAARPGLPQVACFDTAFHRTQPRLAQLFAIPRHLSDEGIVRYGFHGLSYEHIASVLPHHVGARADGRVIVAHLGHGASLCAMRERRSVATSGGFTALDGLVMGKRPGALDPGVVLHLMQQEHMAVDEVADLLNNHCGLLGVSGVSDDVRDLLESGDAGARDAIDLFVHRAIREIGALVAVLGGLDVLVFTAGIGEHCPQVRADIAAGFTWLGVHLDGAANDADAIRVSEAHSAVEVLVLPADEEAAIARATRDRVRAAGRSAAHDRSPVAMPC